MFLDSHATLFLPYQENLIPQPEPGQRVLLINGHPDFPSSGWAAEMKIFQPFYPYAAALEQRGFAVSPQWPPAGESFDHILIRGSKVHVETAGFLAEGLMRLKTGGWLVAAAGNHEGGSRLPKDCKTLAFAAQNLSKHHARIVCGRKTGREDAAVCREWIARAAMQPVIDGRFISQPGLFSWDHADSGSALLTEHLPDDLIGAGADFGCGFGYLADYILRHNPQITALFCIDADARAIECCRCNLAALKSQARITCLWDDLASPVSDMPELDWVVMNPPFHEGKADQIALGQGFIRSAAAALKPGGRLYMVANAHLPYEKTLSMMFARVRKVAEKKGYKIYEARA